MNITMIGAGYVGLTTGTCLANFGNNVICMDVDADKITGLEKGEMPFFEPGLKEMVEQNVKEKRLHFTTDMQKAIQESDIIFLCVGTPSGPDGKADLKYVFSAAESIGKHINGFKVIVDKSTVPVGTAGQVEKKITESMETKHEFAMVSNPEFLREGFAITDFTIPDRIVIGTSSEKAKEMMTKVYKSIERTGRPIMFTDIKTAEMIKYASNAMLATRISFMNLLAPLCEKVGGDVKLVAKGMGLDNRIGPRFLQAGVGYGGSCFPKDVRALIGTLEEQGIDASMLKEVDEVNERQKKTLVPKLKKLLPDLKGKKIAIWGLAFKPRTDDMREAASITVIKQLQAEGATVNAFDPVARKVAETIFEGIEYSFTPYDACEGCDALIIVTEWDEFRNLDFAIVKKMLKAPIIVDGRNIYEHKEMEEAGFQYIGVGR
jgi:UDPglucose 6-dehydrogenase